MKTLLSFCLGGSAAIILFGVANGHAAGATELKPVPASKAGTNSVAVTNALVELPVPVSLFDLTAKQTKDPFFPLSLRRPIPAPTNAAPAFSPTMFTLKGLSGSLENRLALINNRTLAEGEDSEITTATGKIKIHLVAIKESSVVIRADAQPDPLEIFLRKAAQ